MTITNYEKETIINFNAEGDMASIYTHDKGWQNHIEERFGVEPIAENSHGGKEYMIDKTRIKKPVPKRQLSPETVARNRENLAKTRS